MAVTAFRPQHSGSTQSHCLIHCTRILPPRGDGRKATMAASAIMLRLKVTEHQKPRLGLSYNEKHDDKGRGMHGRK